MLPTPRQYSMGNVSITTAYRKFLDKIINYTNEGVPIAYTGPINYRLDISEKHKHILVSPEAWDVLGCTWRTTDDNNTPKVEFFVDLTLPFGPRSSAKLFSEMAHALKLSMLYNGVSDADQYLDPPPPIFGWFYRILDPRIVHYALITPCYVFVNI